MARRTTKVGLRLRKRFSFLENKKTLTLILKKLCIDASKFRYESEHFAKEVPIPGLREINRSNNRILRWLWIAVLIAFLALTLYFIGSSIHEFTNDPIATKVSCLHVIYTVCLNKIKC